MRAFYHNFLGSFLLGSFLLFGGYSCQKNLKSDLPVAHLRMAGHEVQVEIAHRLITRTTGLMFRKEMSWDSGMLFVFPDSSPRAFWMKNTYIPLSIAFMNERAEILNILEMPPRTEERFFSKGPAKFALEMNAGWFSKNGLKAGDLVEGVLAAPKAEE